MSSEKAQENSLRTLKDLGGFRGTFIYGSSKLKSKADEMISISELRAEAIKWVKAEQKIWKEDANIQVINWIMHFFNIKEEDLLEDKKGTTAVQLEYFRQKAEEMLGKPEEDLK